MQGFIKQKRYDQGGSYSAFQEEGIGLKIALNQDLKPRNGELYKSKVLYGILIEIIMCKRELEEELENEKEEVEIKN